MSTLFHREQEPPQPAPPMPMVYIHKDPAYEYKQIVRNLAEESAPDEAELNALGDDGWQIAGLFTHGDSLYLYMQRLK